MRFGLLTKYKKIEGARKDETEGEASYEYDKKAPQISIDVKTGQAIDQGISDQNIHCSISSVIPYYIVATTDPDIDIAEMKKQFGDFVVRISNPLALLKRINTVWKNHPLSFNGCAELKKVVYNKDGLLQPDPYLLGPSDYTYIQKPKKFAKEKEFRYVLTGKTENYETAEPYFILQVAGCKEICRLHSG
ncbi:MAG: hypothetical protein ACE5GY_04530 [Thermodesulfobacteriota bacterium]